MRKTNTRFVAKHYHSVDRTDERHKIVPVTSQKTQISTKHAQLQAALVLDKKIACNKSSDIEQQSAAKEEEEKIISALGKEIAELKERNEAVKNVRNSA